MTSGTDAADAAGAAGPGALAQVMALSEQLLRVSRRRTSAVAGARMETSAFRILWVLSDGAPRTLRHLADDLDLEQSTVNRQVHAALAAGWVERQAVPGSASKLVRPTPAGVAAYDHDALLRAGAIARALEHLGPERSRRLVADLGELNDAWDAAT